MTTLRHDGNHCGTVQEHFQTGVRRPCGAGTIGASLGASSSSQHLSTPHVVADDRVGSNHSCNVTPSSRCSAWGLLMPWLVQLQQLGPAWGLPVLQQQLVHQQLGPQACGALPAMQQPPQQWLAYAPSTTLLLAVVT